jgi:lipopolysaccharide export system protein LptC
MSGMTGRIVVVVLAALVTVGIIWFRNNQPAAFGPCVQLTGTNNEIPVYYRQGASYAAYSSPDCSSESRITI